ncbi:MAG: DNA gyrase inhibitor YacG [Isosphaeraceae bacterium]
MIQGKCPICSKPFAIATLDDLPSFPFCSDRCKLIDLGRWIDGDYAIPVAPEEQEELPTDEPEET